MRKFHFTSVLAQLRFISNVAAPLHCLMKFNSNVQLFLRSLTMSVLRKIAVSLGVAGSIGVIALLMATPVLAAKSKKPPKQPLPRPAPVFSWTGYYAGVNAGGVCTNAVANRGTFGTTFGLLDPMGFVDFGHRIPLLGQFPRFLGGACGFAGGGQFGYNLQSANWVWGVEGDIQGTTLNPDDNRSFPAVNIPALGGSASLMQIPNKLPSSSNGLPRFALAQVFWRPRC
jgi:hypothetical protein